jgi:two-component system, LytTR family, response regulator LytT
MRILIVEDEHKTAVLLKEMIELYPDYTVIDICDSIEATVNYLRMHQENLDIVFMDIQLSDGQCFEIFDKITVNLPVVFCTAYNDYALKAFKNQGVEYILKPFNKKDIHNAILKIEGFKDSFTKHIVQHSHLREAMTKVKTYQTSFLIRLREKIYPVFVTDIAFVCLENEVVYLYNFTGEKYPILKTLDEIENVLSPQQFYRVNRQMIMNRLAIKEIETYYNQRVVVQSTVATTEQVIVPRLKVSPFLNWIEMGE